MPNNATAMERFNKFLAGVDLPRYREKYSQIKLVELDMPRHIRAIPFLYREYWGQDGQHPAAFPSFDDFYCTYSRELKDALEEFRIKTQFSRETFYRGLPARTYRTWASLLTQIQGGYVAEATYGAGNARMSAELDYGGIDIQNVCQERDINLQIKKETMSREVRAPWQDMKRNVRIVVVSYAVPGCEPFTKTGKRSVPFQNWEAHWQDKLARLDNGFIVFLPGMFAPEHILTP